MRISKVVTRNGDKGQTNLAQGDLVSKNEPIINAIGDIDELNSILGLLRANNISSDISGYLLNIQHRLFDIGAELAVKEMKLILLQGR